MILAQYSDKRFCNLTHLLRIFRNGKGELMFELFGGYLDYVNKEHEKHFIELVDSINRSKHGKIEELLNEAPV